VVSLGPVPVAAVGPSPCGGAAEIVVECAPGGGVAQHRRAGLSCMAAFVLVAELRAPLHRQISISSNLGAPGHGGRILVSLRRIARASMRVVGPAAEGRHPRAFAHDPPARPPRGLAGAP